MVKDLSSEIMAYALENAIGFGDTKESIILPKLFQHGLKKQEIKKVIPLISEIVEKVNSMSDEEKREQFSAYKSFLMEKPEKEQKLKDLPNVGTKPIFRMAPFPSGSLHIGNLRAYLLNALYAEKYNGKILLVIDDTIGSEDKPITPEAYDLIPKDFDYLKVKYRKPVKYKSDRLKIYYKYAEKLIRKGNAYVCSCSREEIKENRVREVECSCRHLPVEEHMKRWKEMFKAKPGKYTLRIKTSMQHRNPAFRDRVLFRISDRKHPRTKKKYRVWPLLEFSWAIDDHLFHVTHIIRGKELMIEGEMQKYIWDIFKWKHPELIYNGLIKLEGTGKLSKSKSQREVKSGVFIGWDDPRTWSVQSLARRGILPESLREFIEKIGLTQNDIIIPIDELYAINRRKIDKIANRYFFVENPIEITIEGIPNVNEVLAKLHPEKKEIKHLKVGDKIFVSWKDFNDFRSKKVRLMHLYNVKLDKKAKFISGENDPKFKKIQWVSQGVDSRIMMPNGFYSKGVAEDNIKKLKPGDIIQFERFGFCRFDHYDKKEKVYEFWFMHD